MDDMLIWPLTTDGNYSVKSAYQLLSSESRTTLPSSSEAEGCKLFWNRIWKLQVPNKVKHFLWRASRESLPTKLNLFSRHVLPDKFCNLCKEHPEDTIHCLWLCDGVKGIWLSDPVFSSLQSKVSRYFGDLVKSVLAETSPNVDALFSMVARCIWVRRNKLREKQPVWEVGETVRRAWELLQEFRDVQDRPSRTSVQCLR